MKSSSITRQFMILVLTIVVVMPASLGGLAYIFSANRANARNRAAGNNRRTNALFALGESVGQMQGAVQRVLREKDPDNIEKLMDQSKTTARTVENKLLEARDTGGDIASAFRVLGSTNQRSTELFLRGEAAQAQLTLIEESNPAFERLMSAIGKAQERINAEEAAEEAGADTAESRLQVIIYSLAGLLIAGLIGAAMLLVRNITRTLNHVVEDLISVSDATASAAVQISGSSQVLAQGSSEQAVSLEETSASSDEISAITLKNAESAEQAAEKMQRVASQIAEANTRLEQMVVSMNEINSSSDQISRIIQVIESVAFQTNILALNAAVEAARAGEAGMGFAVVADEVRNLAQRCAQAAQDTSGLIETSIGKTKEGKNRLDEVAATFRVITGSAREVSALVGELYSASREQSRGVKQISTALLQMQHVTQLTASSAEEGAAAGEKLSSQSLVMKNTVARLAVMVNGAAREEATRRDS